MGWCDPVHSSDVVDFKTFANYCCYTTGVPYPTGRDIAATKKAATEIFDEYPYLTWKSLTKVADWSKARKRRFSRLSVLVYAFREAYAAGYLPDLDPNTIEAGCEVELGIEEALQQETNEYWRNVLTRSSGPDARQRVFMAWKESQIHADG